MKKLHIIGLTLVAVSALSALFAMSAFAASLPAEWLANGEKITTPLAADSVGTLVLSDTKSGITVECSGLFEGTVGPGAADTITKVVGLGAGEELFIMCTTTVGNILCTVGTLAEVMAVNLPWTTEALLATETEFRDDITAGTGGNPGYEVECKGFKDTCTGVTSAKATNVTGGVEGLFEEKSENATCSIGGAGAGTVRGSGVTSVSGVTLTISE